MAKNYKTGVIITGDATGAVKAVDLTEKQLKKLNTTTKKTGANTKKLKKNSKDAGLSMKTLAQGAALAGTALAAMGINSLVQDFIDVNTAAERYRGALVTITGDQKLAAQAFSAIEEIAKDMPFTLDQSINAFIKMKNLGLEPSEEALTSFGNTAAAMGKDLNQMIEAVADASTMEFERLKEFGIKAKQNADTVEFTFQGITTTVAKESAEIVKFLENIGDVAFAVAMEEQMQRLPGLFANLEDATDSMFRSFGDAGATFIAADVLGMMIGSTNDLASTTDEAFEFMVTVVGHFANALGGLEIAYESIKQTTRVAVIGILELWQTLVVKVGELFEEFGQDIADFFAPVTDLINDIIDSDAFKAAAGTFKNIIGAENIDLMNQMAGAVGDFAGEVKGAVTDVDAIDAAIDVLQSDFLEGQEDIRKLLEEDLPSEQWENYVETVRVRAAQAKAELIPLNEVLGEINTNTGETGDSSKKFAAGLKEVEGGAASATKEFEKLGSSIEGTFADVLTGQIDSFADFFGSIVNMAAQAASNIAASFAFDFAFGGGANGGGGIAGSFASGAGSAVAGSAGTGILGSLGGSLATSAGLGSSGISGLVGRAGSTFGLTSGSSAVGGGYSFNPATFAVGAAAGIGGGFLGTKAGGLFSDKEANSSAGAVAGGAIGSIWGPVGTFVGSFLGGIVDTLFGSKQKDPRFSIGPTTDPTRQSFARDDLASVTGSAFGNVRFQTDKDAFAGSSQEDAQKFFDFFDLMAGVEDTIAGRLTDDQVSNVSAAVSEQELLYKKNSLEFQEFFIDRFNIIFDEIGGSVDASFDKLASGISDEELLSSIGSITSAALTIGDLGQSLNESVDEIINYKNETKTLFDVYEDMTAATSDMANQFNLSTDSVESLAFALDSQRIVATNLAVSYNVLGKAIEATLAGTVDSINQSILTDEQLYGQRQASIGDLMSQLRFAIDPEEIGLIVTQIDQLTRASFGQLDAEGKKTNADGTISFLQQVESLAGRRIEAGLQAILDAEEEAAAEALEALGLENEEREEMFQTFLDDLGITQEEFLTALNGELGVFGNVSEALFDLENFDFSGVDLFGDGFLSGLDGLDVDFSSFTSAITNFNASTGILSATINGMPTTFTLDQTAFDAGLVTFTGVIEGIDTSFTLDTSVFDASVDEFDGAVDGFGNDADVLETVEFNPIFDPSFNPIFDPIFDFEFNPIFNPVFNPTFNNTYIPPAPVVLQVSGTPPPIMGPPPAPVPVGNWWDKYNIDIDLGEINVGL